MFRSLDEQLPPPEDLSLPQEPQPLRDESQDSAAESAGILRILVLLLFTLAFIPLNRALASFDTTTELFPSHARVENLCYWFTALFTILVFVLAAYLSRALILIRRLVLPFFIAMQLAGGLFMATDRIATLIEGAIDFPSGKTRTSQTLLPISHAYQTHGTHGDKASQYIVTTPIWSNLKISHEDYTYMLTHRPLDDADLEHDEISSFRYFCAKVTIQQTDHALRVLHAGSTELPQGTVIPCPDSLAHPPPFTP